MEDEAIVELSWRRCEEAVRQTAEKYGGYCLALSMHILDSRQDAEECVSDAYWRVWNSVPPQQPRSLKCYLGRIVRNLSLNRYDYRHAEKRSGEFQLLLSEVEEWLPDAAGEAAFEEGEILTAIREYLIALPEGERALFVQRYWHSESIAALAERFGLSQGRVTRVLFRLRRGLRAHLEGKEIFI